MIDADGVIGSGCILTTALAMLTIPVMAGGAIEDEGATGRDVVVMPLSVPGSSKDEGDLDTGEPSPSLADPESREREPGGETIDEAYLRLAFDPRFYFPDRGSAYDRDPMYGQRRMEIRVTYHGWNSLDVGVNPVWAMGIRGDCRENDGVFKMICGETWTARMVAAPALDTEGPWRGAGFALRKSLTRHLEDMPKETPAGKAMAAALSAESPPWLETTSTDCPGLTEAMGASAGAKWVDETFLPPFEPDPALYMHPDLVRVTFQGDYADAEFLGVPKEGTIGGWTVDLFYAVKGCMKPAAAPGPWTAWEAEGRRTTGEVYWEPLRD